jgi:phage anti-repressor protein
LLYARPAQYPPPKKRIKHVVVPEKQHIIRVDGVDDVEAYNNYDEISLFIDFTKKISVVEKKPAQRHIAIGKKVLRGKLLRRGPS